MTLQLAVQQLIIPRVAVSAAVVLPVATVAILQGTSARVVLLGSIRLVMLG